MALTLTVPIDEIPEPGLTIQGELPEEWLAPSLLAAYSPSGAVAVTLLVRKFNANIYAEGRLDATVRFRCSRTLEPGTARLTIDVTELFQPQTASSVNLSDGVDADHIDDELRTYEGKTIDLEPMLRELLVLAQEPYPTVGGASAPADPDTPLWRSNPDDVDPRWAALKNLKLN